MAFFHQVYWSEARPRSCAPLLAPASGASRNLSYEHAISPRNGKPFPSLSRSGRSWRSSKTMNLLHRKNRFSPAPGGPEKSQDSIIRKWLIFRGQDQRHFLDHMMPFLKFWLLYRRGHTLQVQKEPNL